MNRRRPARSTSAGNCSPLCIGSTSRTRREVELYHAEPDRLRNGVMLVFLGAQTQQAIWMGRRCCGGPAPRWTANAEQWGVVRTCPCTEHVVENGGHGQQRQPPGILPDKPVREAVQPVTYMSAHHAIPAPSKCEQSPTEREILHGTGRVPSLCACLNFTGTPAKWHVCGYRAPSEGASGSP